MCLDHQGFGSGVYLASSQVSPSLVSQLGWDVWSYEICRGECVDSAGLMGSPFSPALWLWTAWSGHMAVCVPRQLCHILPQLSLAVCSQPRHRHRHHCHGDGLPGLPGSHQGKQVPASQCELDPMSLTH
jgi:hypothetical protein